MIELPAWGTFDATAAPVLPEHAERAGRLVAVLATPAAQLDGWALATTVEIARAWGRAGHKVVLADLALEAPGVHTQLGAENTEGVADTVLFGASVRRVARPSDDGSYFLITAGTPVADAAAVLGSDRWKRLCGGFIEAGVTLVAYVDAESAGRAAALNLATDILILAAASEDAAELVGAGFAPVRAVMGPAPGGQSDTLPADSEAAIFDPLVEATVDSGDASESTSSEQPAEEGQPAAADLPDAEAAIVEGAVDGEDVTGTAGGSRNRVLLAVSVVILAVFVTAAFGLLEIPWISPEVTAPPMEQDLTPVARSVPVAETTQWLAHSVAVGAFQDPDVAESTAQALTAATGTFASIAPVSVDGSVFHRVLIGPATDSDAAEELAARVANETGFDRSGWVVRATGLAFQLDELADHDAATLRSQTLRDIEVPAYVLAVDYADGSTRYRVYAGAYADEREAAHLLAHLENQGLGNALLTRRLGRIP